jgi:N-acetylglucosaminyldiphosphoundecaprenol N-acetyl-beta-D-mannosaminyltransferase
VKFTKFVFFNIKGIEVASVQKENLKAYLKELLTTGSNSELIITLNLDFLRISVINSEFKKICQHSLVLPDGAGVTSLIKMKYAERIERVTGNDIFRMMLELSNEIIIRFAFVGSSEIVLQKLEKKIRNEYPKAEIAALISPPMNFESDKRINDHLIQALIEAKPDVLFLALGCPRQEIWLHKHKEIIGAKINIGVGAVFDFFSGEKKRSPDIFQKFGLEWFWRLLHEPKRLFKRYVLDDIPFYIKEVLNSKKEK